MSVESKIKELLERAAPGPRYQEGIIPQGSSNIDQKGLADVENLGSEKAGVAASAAAGPTSLPTGQNPGSGEGVVMQGSSQVKDPDEEDLAATGQTQGGKLASAKAGPAAPLPGSNAGGETAVVVQGSSGEATPGQGGTPALATGQIESANADFEKALTEAGIPESAQAALKEAFEKVVVARVEAEIENASDTLAEAVQSLAEAKYQELYEAVNEYLNYAVETWMEKNQVAIEAGLRTEIAEDFISGLKDLFEEHAIEIPEENFDPLKKALADKEELEAKLNESMQQVVKLTESQRTLERRQIVERVTKDMVATDAEKFVKLVEDVEFDTPESFAEKLALHKTRYFSKDAGSKTSLTESSSTELPATVDPSIELYVSALRKTAKR